MVRLLVFLYCAWLMVVYIFFSFKIWDYMPTWLFYMWDKSFGAGFIMWLCLYRNVKANDRYVVAPIVVFSFIRLALDVFSFFTGVTAYNQYRVGVLFLFLTVVFYVLTLNRSNIFHKWISKILFN